MKKNFFKKLAATLALAMVVTSVAPAATASAATGITGAASTIYATKAYSLKLGKGVNAKWTSSNKAIATVGLTGGKLKATKAGKVTITAKSTKTGKSYKKTFVVKQRATSVELGDDLSLAVGATSTLKAVLTPATSTDVVRFVSDNKEVATVGLTGGKVTAKANGEATITVYAKATTASATASKMNKVDTIKVKVGTFIESAAQQSDTKLDVTFNADMKDAKAADFKIVSDDTKRDYAIKEIKIDGKKVTAETFAEINDGKTYTVTYKDSASKFVATDNKVANIAITPATVPAEVKTEVKVLVKDANGVILSENPFGASSNDSKLDFNIETTAGYTDGSKLFLFKVGDTAKATAKYHTYDYVDGKEVGLLETELTITAVDKNAMSLNDYKYTVVDTGKAPSNWSTATLNDKLAIEDAGKSIYVNLKDNNGDVITDGYSLSSSNDNILLVSGTGLEATLEAVATGTAYVLVKDTDADKVVLSLPINIVAKRKAASISSDKATVTLALGSTPIDTETVKLTVKDQYGDKIAVGNWTEVLNAEVLSGAPSITSVSGDQVNLTAADYTVGAGTYNYNVKYGSLVASLKVIVKAQAAASVTGVSYMPEVSDAKIDTVINDDVTTTKDLTVKVALTRGNVFAEYANIKTYEIKNLSTNKVVASDAGLVVGTTITENAFTIATPSYKNLEPGNYSVTMYVPVYTWDGTTLNADLVKTQKVTAGFVVVDTQAKVEVKQLKTSDCVTIDDAFEFNYNGNKVTAPNTTVVSEVVSGKTHFVKKVTIEVQEGLKTVQLTVEINKSYTDR